MKTGMPWVPAVAGMTAGLLLILSSAVRAEPDEDLLGKSRNYPIGDARTWYHEEFRVGSWSALDRVAGFRVAPVAPAAQPQPLPRAGNAPPIAYRFRNIRYTLADYLERQRATGLLVLKDGAIVAEHYRYGRTEEARFLSFSMAKTLTGLLVGIAHERGAIASLDDRAEKYAKALQGTAYGATPIRHLLRMSSGLTFTERYDGNDDISRLTAAYAQSPTGTVDVLRTITARHAPSGEQFQYASAETDVLGRVLTGATGRTLAELTSEWLWQPLGAERPAFWRIGRDGQAGSFGHFNAALRDWGRVGLMLARDGRVGERQVVPREFLLDATDVQRQPPGFQPQRATPFLGYGYQVWLWPARDRTFVLQGIYGQAVYVQPASGIVLVVTSVWKQASNRQDPLPGQERNALWRGVLESLGGRPD